MTQIYIIRHTQAEGNIYRMMQGHWDGNVTQKGEKQLELLAERFRGQILDAVYASDLYRTRRTGKAVAKYHDIPLQTDRRLREIHLGRWEAKFFGNLEHDEPEAVYSFMNDRENWHTEGAESFEQVACRVYEAIEEIAKKHEGQTVAISSHGVSIRAFLCKVAGVSYDDINAVPALGNTAVSLVTYDNGTFQIEYINDSSHLAAMASTPWNKTPTLRSESFDPRTDKVYYSQTYADCWMASHGNTKRYTPEPYYSLAIQHYLADADNVQRMYNQNEPAGILEMDSERGADEGYLWIVLLFLQKELRYMGCGTQIFGRAVAQCRKLGRDRIRLSVAEENHSAIHFYENLGFETLRHEPGPEGGSRIMELNIEVREDA